MTKEEIDELGSMAMKVIVDHPLTEEEEERFIELNEKLEKMNGVSATSEEVLAGDGDGHTIVAGRTSDDSDGVVESDSPDLRR